MAKTKGKAAAPVREFVPKVVQVPLARLHPAPYNPRVMSRHDQEALKASLEEFGAVEPIVANKDGMVIGGHQRLDAAKALGLKTIPVIYVELTPQKAQLLNLALNRIHGQWDEPKLEGLLAELKAADLDLTLAGFTSVELDRMLRDFAADMPEVGVARGDDRIGGAQDTVDLVLHLAPADYALVMDRLAKTGGSTPEEQLVKLVRGG